MKIYTSLAVLFLFLSPLWSVAQEIESIQIDFVNAFVDAVESHNHKKVIKMMNKTYRKDQIKFLKGNKRQFIDELFGGSDIVTDAFVSIKFNEIQKVEIAEVIALKEGGYNYIFRLRSGQHDVLCSLLLVIENKKYGFVGASG